MAPDNWAWDETLYAGSAAYYATGRFPYPPEVPQALRDHLGLDGTGRLLDVGCGPGSLTLPLAPLFAAAVGLDADPDMITEARVAARRAGLGTVDWYRGRAEDLPAGLGRFRVVTFAQSLHWLDRAAVAATVRDMLGPGGALVLVHATTHEGAPGADPLPHPRPPRDEINRLVTSFLGPVRRAGAGVLPGGTPGGEDRVLRAAGFREQVRLDVGGGAVRERTVDEVVASVYSLSSAAPHLFGDRLDDFDARLRALLRRAAPDGRFAERQREVGLGIWRPASG